MSHYQPHKSLYIVCMVVAFVGAGIQAAKAQTGNYHVIINTTGLNGQTGSLAFDFIDGDGAGNNSATISGFTSNGLLNSGGANTANASGSLPGTITMTDSAFTEASQAFTFGTSLSFDVALTNQFTGVGVPDEFSFFLLNPIQTSSLVSTADPTGANTLFALDITGTPGGSVTTYNSFTPNVSSNVSTNAQLTPDGSSLYLLMSGCSPGVILLGYRRLRQRRGTR